MQRVHEMKYSNVEQIKITEFKWETKGNIDICNRFYVLCMFLETKGV